MSNLGKLNQTQLQFVHGYGIGYDHRMPFTDHPDQSGVVYTDAFKLGQAKGRADRATDDGFGIKTGSVLRDARKRAVLDPDYDPDIQSRPTIVLVLDDSEESSSEEKPDV